MAAFYLSFAHDLLSSACALRALCGSRRSVQHCRSSGCVGHIAEHVVGAFAGSSVFLLRVEVVAAQLGEVGVVEQRPALREDVLERLVKRGERLIVRLGRRLASRVSGCGGAGKRHTQVAAGPLVVAGGQGG